MTISTSLANVIRYFSGRSILWMRGQDDDQFAVGDSEKAVWKGKSGEWRRNMYIAAIDKKQGRNQLCIEWGTPHRGSTQFYTGKSNLNACLGLKEIAMLHELMKKNDSSSVTLLVQPEYNRVAFGLNGGDHQLSGYVTQSGETRHYNGYIVPPTQPMVKPKPGPDDGLA
jgi:hypothetical protein